jgi:hypothetical protein
MIDLGLKNKILMLDGSQYVLGYLIDFLDLQGKNVLYIHSDYKNQSVKDVTKCTNIKIHPQESWENIESKILSSLFRLDVIIIESQPTRLHNKIEHLIDQKVKLTTLYLTENSVTFHDESNYRGQYNLYTFLKRSDATMNLGIKRFLSENIKKSLFIQDNINNWELSVSDLESAWIRDKKIDDLLNDNP